MAQTFPGAGGRRSKGSVRANARQQGSPREARVSTTMRLRQTLRRDLEAAAAQRHRSVAEIAQELLEEGLRMRRCPGIYFADEPSGRTAKIGGTGLAVWEVLRDLLRDADPKRIRETFPQLSQAQVTAALMYERRYTEEIQREIARNAGLTPEAIEQRYPGLVRFVSTE
jgi:uncharacterized protein (DUF433 family)